jgi:hypothetical protein
MTTYREFFTAVLTGINCPITEGALQGLATVVHEEGANAYYNPLNIEWNPGSPLVYKGVRAHNSVGVQEYGSVTAGIDATRVWLGQSGWADVLRALDGGSYMSVVSALTARYTWATYNPGMQADATARLAQTMPGTTMGTPPPPPPASPVVETEYTMDQILEALALFFKPGAQPGDPLHTAEGWGRLTQLDESAPIVGAIAGAVVKALGKTAS